MAEATSFWDASWLPKSPSIRIFRVSVSVAGFWGSDASVGVLRRFSESAALEQKTRRKKDRRRRFTFEL
jgi:hypothetical protein